MKTFLIWLELLAVALTAVLVVFFAVAYNTGGGLSDTEQQVLIYGLVVWMGVIGVGYICDPRIPPMRGRRRR